MSNISTKTFALAAAAAFATATPLALAPDLAPVAVAQNNQAVDVNKTGTLTINKQEGDPGAATGTVEGTEFTVERVQMTNGLNTAAGWTEAGNIVSAGAGEAAIDTTFTAQTKATDADGVAAFTDLPVGIYKVTEKTNGNYTVAAPFLVTLPLTQQDGSLTYTPTVSPKNQKLDPTKAADDANANIGDQITYTIKAPVPAGDVLQDGSRTISQFRITDDLQQELTYVADSAEVTLAGADDTTLGEGDYTISNDGQNLTVEFTPAGLQRLETLRADNPGLTVQVVFKAEVNAIPANGQIDNTANVYVPNRDEPIQSKPETEKDGDQDTNDTTTQYANVEVTKTLNGNPVEDGKTGNGAEFEIYPCAPEGEGYAVADGAEAIKGTATANSTEVATTFTAQGGDVDSAKAAVASGFGMQLNPTVQYCAVETKAPAGYLVNPDPQLLTLTTKGTDTNRPVYTVAVNDVKDNIFGRLPATGERTMLYILALGLVLFGGGAAYQLSRRNA